MSFWSRSYFFLVLAVAMSTYSCSNTPPAGEASGNPDAASDASTESAADQVGSVPEDMLADEQGGGDGSAAEAAAEGSTEADPFNDLQAEQQATTQDSAKADQSMAVAEDAPAASEGSGKIENYKVKSGDTLMKIAFHLYGDLDRWKDLLELNREKLKSGNHLRKGMSLRYEAPLEPFQPEEHARSYQIKSGDTLANIADEVYGRKAKFKKLQNYNKSLIKNPNRIFAGFTIFYDITEKEIAEAEARRAERLAAKGSAPAPQPIAPEPPAVPSAIAPPAEAAPAPNNVAVTPSASDNSIMPGPGAAPAAAPAGPPAPAPAQ